jgi:D-alanyl-D-alanine carboxypeptidase
MMTLYLLFEQLKAGKVTMSTMLPISQHAAEQHATNLHLWAGDSIPVDTAIKAIVVRSANDVAVAIGEYIGGTESHFGELMTAKARELGMRSTFYHNASGLPDPLQITTASDLATLARHLAYDFPQYFHYFSTPSFYYRGTNYVTHDNLIGRYDGADGIKTGFTEMSGFNLVSSVVRGGAHIVGVVMGGRTAHLRDREMVSLLDGAFLQIAANPSLVARNGVPWQEVAEAAPAATPAVPASNGFVPAPAANQAAVGPAVAMLAPSPNFTAATDEDSAEAQTNEGNVDLGPKTPIAPLAKPILIKPLPAPPPQVASVAIPAIRPMRKPFVNVGPAMAAAQPHAPIVIAAYAEAEAPRGDRRRRYLL